MKKELIKRNFDEYIQDSIYKINNEDFRLWIEYLKKHPIKSYLENYRKSKLNK